MSLPVVVDMAIGLIFIYLILSLLASEIQELLTTLLQWRAKHLKESIEILLAGGIGTQEQNLRNISPEIIQTRALANRLYSHPLIRTLNFEQLGGLGGLARKPMQWIDKNLLRKINQQRLGEDIFADSNSAPSYIPPENFAATVLETLHIPQVMQGVNSDQVEQLKQESFNILEIAWGYLWNDQNIPEEALLSLDQERLQKVISLLIDDFKNNRITLSELLKKIDSQLQEYIDLANYYLPDSPNKTNFIHYLNLIKQKIYLDEDKATFLDSSIANVRMVIQAYQQINNNQHNPNDPIQKKIDEISMEVFGDPEKLRQDIKNLPSNLINTLSSLASQTHEDLENLETELNTYKQNLEKWFDQGMARANGVYKRNATGITFVIGFLMAICFNADTFHIADRLYKDPMLREVIVEQAQQTQASNPDLSQPITIPPEVENQLDAMGLPLGWTEQNLTSQAEYRNNLTFLNLPLGWARQFIGWVITAIAIVMGAPFWFDLMGKFINVKNMGKKS